MMRPLLLGAMLAVLPTLVGANAMAQSGAVLPNGVALDDRHGGDVTGGPVAERPAFDAFGEPVEDDIPAMDVDGDAAPMDVDFDAAPMDVDFDAAPMDVDFDVSPMDGSAESDMAAMDEPMAGTRKGERGGPDRGMERRGMGRGGMGRGGMEWGGHAEARRAMRRERRAARRERRRERREARRQARRAQMAAAQQAEKGVDLHMSGEVVRLRVSCGNDSMMDCMNAIVPLLDVIAPPVDLTVVPAPAPAAMPAPPMPAGEAPAPVTDGSVNDGPAAAPGAADAEAQNDPEPADGGETTADDDADTAN